MTNAFISYSSKTLADSNKGFTGSEIVRRFVEYSVKFNKPIPFHNNVFSKDGKLIPKREAFRMNLECFSDEEKYLMIYVQIQDLQAQTKYLVLESNFIMIFPI